MTDERVTNALIYTTLQDVQTRIGRVEHSLHVVSGKISAMDSHLAGFYQALRIQTDEQDEQRGRIEALESAVNDLKSTDPEP